jgi:enediyne biosynthesis protein E4
MKGQFLARGLFFLNLQARLLLLIAVSFVGAGCQQKSPLEVGKKSPETAPLSPSTPSQVQPSPGPAPQVKSEVPRSSGAVEFVDVTAQSGIHFKHNTGAFGKKYLPETMGSGVCFIDYDNDGWQDIFLVNSMDWAEHKTVKSFPALYHNNHDGTFTDVTQQAGLAIETYGLGCAVGDQSPLPQFGQRQVRRRYHKGRRRQPRIFRECCVV